jgi:hypothetical protein
MSYAKLLTLRIDFHDGSTETIDFTYMGSTRGPGFIEDGALHLYSQDGSMAPLVHEGSWPLSNIKRYRVTER